MFNSLGSLLARHICPLLVGEVFLFVCLFFFCFVLFFALFCFVVGLFGFFSSKMGSCQS